jgi:hypothetical protein
MLACVSSGLAGIVVLASAIVPPVQALWRKYGGTMAEWRMAEQFRFRR